jgi:hypothetical protein
VRRLGFSFVDTPGVGSAIAANTAATESFLPEADAVIFVTSFDAPLSEAELAFLAKVRTYVEKLFLVVNKLDLVPAAEAESILAYVRDRVDGEDVGAELRAFAISARQALEARTDGDRRRLAESGLPELERPLVRFLTGEKSRVFLVQVAGRAERLPRRQRLDLELGRLAQSGDSAGREARRALFEERLEALIGELRAAAAALERRLAESFPAALAEVARAWSEELEAVLGPELARREWQLSGTARNQLTAMRAELLESAQPVLEEWFRERVSEGRPLLLRLAGDEIGRLRSLQRSVDRSGAEAFGVAAPEDAEADITVSPVDLAPLALRPVSFDLPLDPAWWSAVVPARLGEARGRARLRASLERGIAAYCVAVQQALAEAAVEWARAFGAEAEAETRRAVDRLRERLRVPGAERQLALLDELEQRLAAFRAELLDCHPESSETATAETDEVLRLAPGRRPIGSCVICERIRAVPFEYLAPTQYDLATRQDSRAEHAARGGFCTLHTWQYAETASDLGIALPYAEFAQQGTGGDDISVGAAVAVGGRRRDVGHPGRRAQGGRDSRAGSAAGSEGGDQRAPELPRERCRGPGLRRRLGVHRRHRRRRPRVRGVRRARDGRRRLVHDRPDSAALPPSGSAAVARQHSIAPSQVVVRAGRQTTSPGKRASSWPSSFVRTSRRRSRRSRRPSAAGCAGRCSGCRPGPGRR